MFSSPNQKLPILSRISPSCTNPVRRRTFRFFPLSNENTLIDVDSKGGWIAVVIFSWIIILGIVSLVGIEIGTVEISVSLVASLFFAMLVNFLYKKSKRSQRS